MTNFDSAVAFVLKEEGGYVNNPNDPGGETNFGISKRAYPEVDIAGLTADTAAEIYRRDYWDKLGDMEGLPAGLALLALDCAVNQGVGRARRFLAETHEPLEVQLLRLESYCALAQWPTFGKGWTRRLLRGMDAAARL